jgi:fructokinase
MKIKQQNSIEQQSPVSKTVVGIGEILWDMLPTGKVLGGAPANFAYVASQFGCDGYIVSAVGKDSLGEEIIETLENKRLNYLIEAVDYPTGTVQVTLDGKGVPQYEICENVAWDNIPYTQSIEELARRCNAVCFGSLTQRNVASRAAIRRFLDSVSGTAVKIFDINLRQHFYDRETIEASLALCNILKINDEELGIVASLFGFGDMPEAEACLKLLHDYALDMVIETRSSAGSYVLSPTDSSLMETPAVEVADTVGAGDAFGGAFIAALLHGETLRNAHRLAVEVAAYVCTQHGAMPEIKKMNKSIKQ